MKAHIIFIDKVINFLKKIKEGLIYCIKPNQKNIDEGYKKSK